MGLFFILHRGVARIQSGEGGEYHDITERVGYEKRNRVYCGIIYPSDIVGFEVRYFDSGMLQRCFWGNKRGMNSPRGWLLCSLGP